MLGPVETEVSSQVTGGEKCRASGSALVDEAHSVVPTGRLRNEKCDNSTFVEPWKLEWWDVPEPRIEAATDAAGDRESLRS
jgi:hypothetical protein